MTKKRSVLNGSKDSYSYIRAGRSLTASSAKRLEQALIVKPNDLGIRQTLLGYYLNRSNSKLAKQALFDHTIWMIDHHSSDSFCYYLCSVELTPRQFAKSREHWLEQVRLHPNGPNVYGNAASFLDDRDYEVAEYLYQRAQALAPNDERWTRRLCYLYGYQARNSPHIYLKRYADLALAESDKMLTLKNSWGERAGVLIQFAPFAIDVGDFDRARTYSNALLKMGRSDKSCLWEQYAWLYLANIEFLQDRLAMATQYLSKLLLSLNGHPSHVGLNPRMMSLLEQYLKRGETALVIDALRTCNLAPLHRPKKVIRMWITMILNGEKPDLNHRFD